MLTSCLTCGSRKVVRRLVEELPQRGGKPTTVMVEVCLSCGERYYDLAAMQALERARRRPVRKRRTA